jgi:DNA-binding LacI/PurR family transcriptional regulator
MLLWHDELLVNHPDPDAPPLFADVDGQRAILRGFVDQHGDSVGGYVLDHMWQDEALAVAPRSMQRAVLLYRRAPTGLAGLSNVRADFAVAATQALAHVFARGYSTVVPVVPFRGDPAVEEFLSELDRAVVTLGCSGAMQPRVVAEDALAREALVRQFSSSERIAFIVPEDHTAVRLRDSLASGGVSVPAQAGVVAVMGTSVAEVAGLTRLRFPFRQMGTLAVEILAEETRRDVVVPPELVLGGST